ncbi:MAG: branched-chain amino acid ABC transporter permease, partial [Actinomycetota bacterium]|nr:branched-chain amino acid ABC transporter permease [Actinomycetota bacterium]
MATTGVLASSWITSQLVVDGLSNGLVIGLVAIGLVLVHRTTQVINFAVGAMGVVGATVLALLVLQYGLSYWVALPLVLLLGTAWGTAVELGVIRRLFDAPRVILLVATIGIAGLSVTLTQLVPTPDGAFAATYPVGITTVWDDLGGVRLTGAQLQIAVVVPLVAAALGWFLTATTIGKAVGASADNPRLARTMGINPRFVSTGVWATSGLLATLAMVLISGQAQSVTGVADLGPNIMLRALAAFLVAGMASFPRAMVAGVAIGVAEALVRFNFLSEAGLVDLGLFVAVLVAVWFQTRGAGDTTGGLGGFAPAVRPAPAAIADRWWVRHLDTMTGVAALGGGVVLAVAVTSPSRLQLFATIAAFAICASSLTLLVGWAGQPSLGQMAFAGVGALVAAAAARGAEATLGWGGRSWTFAAEPVPFVVAILLGAL